MAFFTSAINTLQTLVVALGAGLGVWGVVYCVLLCWLLSYLGVLIGKDTMSHTMLGRFFLIFDSLTSNL